MQDDVDGMETRRPRPVDQVPQGIARLGERAVHRSERSTKVAALRSRSGECRRYRRRRRRRPSHWRRRRGPAPREPAARDVRPRCPSSHAAAMRAEAGGDLGEPGDRSAMIWATGLMASIRPATWPVRGRSRPPYRRRNKGPWRCRTRPSPAALVGRRSRSRRVVFRCATLLGTAAKAVEEHRAGLFRRQYRVLPIGVPATPPPETIRVPICTPSAPRAKAAAMVRPQAMPPTAISGVRLLADERQRTMVETSFGFLKPPPSAPSTTSPSTPASTAFSAAFSVGTT